MRSRIGGKEMQEILEFHESRLKEQGLTSAQCQDSITILELINEIVELQYDVLRDHYGYQPMKDRYVTTPTTKI